MTFLADNFHIARPDVSGSTVALSVLFARWEAAKTQEFALNEAYLDADEAMMESGQTKESRDACDAAERAHDAMVVHRKDLGAEICRAPICTLGDALLKLRVANDIAKEMAEDEASSPISPASTRSTRSSPSWAPRGWRDHGLHRGRVPSRSVAGPSRAR